MVQNIVIGSPLCSPSLLLAKDIEDWETNEKSNTLFTNERFLPRLLVSAGIAPSVNEVRRNRPELVKSLDHVDFIKIKWGKKFLWIVVGEENKDASSN